MRKPSSSALPKGPEQPLTGAALTLLALSATAVTALFYLGCVAALLLVGVLLLLEVALLVALVRFGLSRVMLGPIQAQAHLAALILEGLNLKEGPQYSMPVERDDAPGLFAMTERVARAVQVPPPDRVVLEMELNAWVRLRGYRRGRGHCTLGVGYDLLAVLAEDELEAVLAHEMAHAKLIQRGYKGWLARAVARMARLAGALLGLAGAGKAAKKRFWTAELLARGAELLGRQGTRLFAAYSRQDEFAADRIAAERCGPAAGRRALMKIHVAGQRSPHLEWRGRLVQAERGEGFSAWLRERLLPRTEEEAREREAKALRDSRRGEFDTHPSLADRLAALGSESGAPSGPAVETTVGTGQNPPSRVPARDAARPCGGAFQATGESAAPPALGLLRNADELALRLLTEVERIANEQERRASRELQQRARKQYRGRKQSPQQLGAGVLIILGMVFGVMAVTTLSEPGPAGAVAWPWLAGAVGAIAAGVVIYRKFPFRERIVLPVPAWSLLAEAMEPETRARVTREPIEPLEAEMRAQMPAAVRGKRALARYWSVESYRALEQCDFRRAGIAGRLCLAADSHCLEGALGRGLGAAYLGQPQVAHQMLGWAVTTHGLGTSVSWGLGWGLAMLGNWAEAEAYLLDAAARCPDRAPVRSLLGMAQWRLGKVREAAQSVRQAAALEPDEPRHRILLARILLAAGRAKEALKELDAVEAAAGADYDAMLAGVGAHLLLGHLEEAARRAAQLEDAHPGPRTLLGLARAYGDAERYEETVPLLERVGESGFYPEACLGLARAAYERKEMDQCRAHLLAALDLTREPGAGAQKPLDMLESVARGLAALREPVEGCHAWNTTVYIASAATGTRKLTLLVCAPSQEAAAEQVCELYRAMHPDQELADAQITWEPVEKEQQPEGLATPGVYGHRVE